VETFFAEKMVLMLNDPEHLALLGLAGVESDKAHAHSFEFELSNRNVFIKVSRAPTPRPPRRTPRCGRRISRTSMPLSSLLRKKGKGKKLSSFLAWEDGDCGGKDPLPLVILRRVIPPPRLVPGQ